MEETVKWITQYDVMRKLQISRSTLHRWCKKGYLRRYTMPGSRIIYFKDKEIDDILSSKCIDESGNFDETGLQGRDRSRI